MTTERKSEADVQRILALKRHEQPPPAFFQSFSDQVIDRIQSAGPAPRPTLRQRLSIEFYGVPIYVCAAGVAVCGLLAFGLIASFRVGPAKPTASTSSPDPLGGDTQTGQPLVPPTRTTTIRPVNEGEPGAARPIVPVRASLGTTEPANR